MTPCFLKCLVERATKFYFTLGPWWFKKKSKIPGIVAMVSKLGGFFLAQTFCYLLHALWGSSCWDSTLDVSSVSSSLSTLTWAISRALKWPAKTIVGKATMKKPRSKMVAASIRLRLQQSPNDGFGNRWTSWTSFPNYRNFLEGSFPLERFRQKSENKYSKFEYGSVSGVFQSPELKEQKK